MEKLNFPTLLDVIGELFSDEISIAVTDTKKYIYYRKSKRIDLKIKQGDPIKEGTLAYKAITSKQKVSEFIHKNVYGIPYHGMAVPFHQDEQLAGCVLAIYPSYTEGKSVITIKTDDGWQPIPYNKVQYIEAKDRKAHIFTNEYAGSHSNTLQEFEYSLPIHSFIRCHRSFIVNVNHIEHIYPDSHSTFFLEMKNKAKIPVSQSYSSYFRKMLGF